ncbi:MAG: hypothetical protein U9P71_07005 [Campylobacterota bacterium]|nr:hypothetical protein [Campylobacterota bacterium]
MKRFIYLFILLSFINLNLFADSCGSRVFYANGVGVKKQERDLLLAWKEQYISLGLDGTPSISYNQSEGMIADFLEAYQQLNGDDQWGWFWDIFGALPDLMLDIIYKYFNYDELHDITLNEQIDAYRTALKAGQSVIVVAHSQGNYFTNEAYDILLKEFGSCSNIKFRMISVATPADHVSNGGNHFTFDNDPIHLIPGSLNWNLRNTNRADPDWPSIRFHGLIQK